MALFVPRTRNRWDAFIDTNLNYGLICTQDKDWWYAFIDTNHSYALILICSRGRWDNFKDISLNHGLSYAKDKEPMRCFCSRKSQLQPPLYREQGTGEMLV